MNRRKDVPPRFDDRRLKIVAWLVALFSLSLIMIAGLLFQWNRPAIGQGSSLVIYAEMILGLGYGIVGLLILVHRPRHGIGWLFLGVAFLSAVNVFAKHYAIYGLVISAWPAARWMAWLQSWVFYLVFPGPIILLFFIFPNGRLPSRRWRPLVWLAVFSTALLVVAELVRPDMLVVYFSDRSIELEVFNPTGVTGWTGVSDILNTAWVLSIILLPVALLAPIWRYRRAPSAERQQLKWFVFFAILALLLFPLVFVMGGSSGEIFLILLMLALPIAAAIAILRYQLYDIDVIIRKTAVYALLSALLALVYFGLVILLQGLFEAVSGEQSAISIVVSTLVIAALFAPLRRWVQDFIDRRFYRRKYDAEKTLAAFGQFVRDETDLEALTAELASVVQETMQPDKVILWLRPAFGPEAEQMARADHSLKSKRYGTASGLNA